MKSIKVVLLSIIITPGVPTAQSQIIIIQIPTVVLPPSPMMKVASGFERPLSCDGSDGAPL